MRRVAIAAIAALAGCAWSNSLYQARTLSANAESAERERRPGDAALLWGQVIVKAESAYARSPRGTRGAEALWLGGHAAVRIHDCARAVPSLESAMSAGQNAPWRQEMLFELAGCEEANGGPTAASLYETIIASSRDPVIVRSARLRLGHARVLRGDASGALAVLAGDDSMPARLDRAMAYAQLGRGGDALRELAGPLGAADTTVRWLGFIDTLTVHDSPATDTLLLRLLDFPGSSAETKSAWLLDAARAALVFDPSAADRRLRTLATRPPGGAAASGRFLQQQLRLLRPATLPALRAVVDSMSRTPLNDDGFGARRVAELLRIARELVSRNDSIAAGRPAGDLGMLGLAALAYDSLGSSRLAGWFFARLESDWPRSPYVGKALMAREPLEPDSADALITRLRRLGDNPYVNAANGDLAGMVRVSQLEDSLGRFVERMRTMRPERP